MKPSFKIKKVKAREVLDGRGDPTIEVDVLTEGGILGRADVPSGRSTGKHEAFELKDGGSRYQGKGVLKAVKNINEIIAPELNGKNVTEQKEIDKIMINLDGTSDKSKLGANAIVGVSLAAAKSAAESLGTPLYRYIGGPKARILPVPLLNLVNGGKLAASELDFQEHIVMPTGAKTFSEAIRMGSEVYHELGKILEKKWGRHSLNVGDEGGYTPPGMEDVREAFDVELEAIEGLGYANKFALALDVAASHLYDKKREVYIVKGKDMTREDLIEFYKELVATYPIESIEDPLEQDDFDGFAELTKTLGVQIVGDDLFVTNEERLKRGIEVGAGNALLWKVNQVGTLTEALDVAQFAFKNGYNVQVSERSGQTEDTWLSDMAVALNCGQIKTGAPCRGERTAQYNRLLRIEEGLGNSGKYAGKEFRCPANARGSKSSVS